MEGNPLFSSLMGMQGDMMKNLQQPKQEEQTRKINLSNPSHDPNPTKQRLQKKLKEKQMKNMTVEKVD